MATGSQNLTTYQANKLSNERELYVDLATTRDSNSQVLFDGSADKILHVANTLPLGQGGTGATSAAGARSAIENGNYLTCDIAAATATKTIALTDFVLNTGVIVNVKFTVQNSASSPTLNINNTGAKSIYCNGVQVKSYGLKANVIYRLMYDGTYWQVINNITPDPSISSTSAGTSTKVVNANGFVQYPGATVWVKFSNNNTVLTPKLNINGYGATSIRNKNQTSGTFTSIFRPDTYYEFMYTGSEFVITNHLLQENVTLGVTAVAEVTDPDTGEVTTPAVPAVHGTDVLVLGNSTNSTTTNGLTGVLALYNASTKCVKISAEANSAGTERTWYLPNLNSNRYFITHSAATALGSVSKPIYVKANGEAAEADTYAGGTAVTLNGTSKAKTTASFYAPTGGGTAGYILKAGGDSTAPSWIQKVPVANGGTNATSVTKFGIAYGNSSADAYAFTAAGSDGYILIGKGADTAPTWQQILPIGHGGTGASTVAGARQALFGDDMSSSTEYFITINTNWAKGGYITNSKAMEIIRSNASGTWAIKATYLTDLSSSDAASSTSTDRYVWFSCDDNKTGRPAYDTNFTYRSDTKTLTVSRINLNRYTAATYGRLQWYKDTYKTWTTYMSNAAASACPSGGTPSTLGNVTNWALRSYIENSSGYGWLWESAAESNTGTPTARMALSSNDGTLEVAGLIKSTYNSNTVTIGSQNANWCHIYNSADVPFIFNKSVQVVGKANLGGTSYPWGNIYIGGADNGIYFVGTKNNYRMIRFIDNTADIYGNGISIGGGGVTILGSGESSDTLIANLSITGGTETTYISSDGNIEFYPGQNSYDASARIWMTASVLNIGVDGNTTRESSVNVYSGAGRIQLYSAASTTGNRGLWVAAHGTGNAKNVILVDTNNNVTLNGTATAANYLSTYVGSSTSQNYVGALQNCFTSVPKSVGTAVRLEFGGHAMALGYFLAGTNYNTTSTAYGGWFVAYYGTPHYVGISNGTWTDNVLIHSNNYTSYTVTKTGTGASGSWGISITGNAATASKITNITSSDAASSSDTWRRIWICYADNVTGRPAYTDSFAFQTSTGTMKTGRIDCWPTAGSNSYNEGIRVHCSSGNWATIMLCANDNTGNTGTSTKSWGIFNNDGTLYINKAASSGAGNPRVYANANGWYFTKAYGAVWNDYAEYRQANTTEPGRVIIPSKDGIAHLSTERLQSGGRIISDTYGFAVGESDKAKTPVGLSGRVLAYPYQNIENYKIGDAVCTAPNGTVDIMSREEIKEYPERIIGIVNEIPNYDMWEENLECPGGEPTTTKIIVNGRIWIDVR